MNGNAGKKPFKWLLLIPIQLVLDVALFVLAAMIDIYVIPDPSAVGHPMPVFMLIAMLVLPLMTIVVLILSIVMHVVTRKRIRRESMQG